MKRPQLFIVFLFLISFVFIAPQSSTAANIVQPKQTYTYEVMVKDMKALAKKYPDIIQYKIIGNSEYNRPIYAISLGTGHANVFINGSHHAREWISTTLNMYMIEQYADMYASNKKFGDYDVKSILDETTIWFVPMVNPDGVTLQQFGLSKFPKKDHAALLRMNDGSNSFTRWKANAKGVDLNRQYDADWANIKSNRKNPSWSHHKGYKPEQATETKAIVKFTKEIKPEMAVAYHSSGEVLYWNFHQKGNIYTRDHQYAKKISLLTSYQLIYPGKNPSGGGYTDWFIQTFQRPGFTPELSPHVGNTHVPTGRFGTIWSQNCYVGLYTASEGYKLYIARGGQPKYPEVTIAIDGKPVKFSHPALLIDQNTVVPAQEVFEKLGAVVESDEKTKRLIIRSGTSYVELTTGVQTMRVNGKEVKLAAAPRLIKGEMMIPLRAVSDAIGAEIGWIQDTATATITSPEVRLENESPALPIVQPITDITQAVTGTSEVNSLVLIKKEGRQLGSFRVNSDGKFHLPIPVQGGGTILEITATNLSGVMSDVVSITVSYTSTFTDSVTHWAADAIGYLKDHEITKGYSDGSFGTDDFITRAEAATLLVRAMAFEGSEETALSFQDVPKNDPFYSYIVTIAENNIMNGRKEGLFYPADTLTRAEMATILTNTFNLINKGTIDFSDVKQTHWAFERIQTLASNEIIKGYENGTFKPDHPITRAEFATLLVRVLQLEQENEETDAGKEEEEEENGGDEESHGDGSLDSPISETTPEKLDGNQGDESLDSPTLEKMNPAS